MNSDGDKKRTRNYSIPYIYRNLITTMNRENHLLLPAALLGIITLIVMNYFPVLFQRRFLNEVTGGGTLRSIGILAVIYFAVMSISAFLHFLGKFYFEPRINLVRLHFLALLLGKKMKIDLKYIEDSEYMNKIEAAMVSTNGNQTGYEAILRSIFTVPPLFISTIMFSLLLGKLSILIPLLCFLNAFMDFYISRKVETYRYSLKEKEAGYSRLKNMALNSMSDYSYGKEIRIYGLKDRLISFFEEKAQNWADIYRSIFTKKFNLGFITSVSSLISDVVIYGIMVRGLINGMTPADFSMYFLAAVSLSQNLKDIIPNISSVISESWYVDDSLTFINEPLENAGGKITVRPEGPQEIEFKNVTFRYSGTDQDVLKNFSLRIRKGEKLAVVGINGAGKTTLVKLMTGLFEPDEGEILIGGKNINEYSKDTLFGMFSTVFQYVNIMPYDIRTNVTGSDGDLTEETESKVMDVLARAGLGEKVRSLPDGINQKLNKGVYEDAVDLSGGENQKLTIARALYKDGNILIMDEPTAALDALAEQEIYQSLNEMAGSKTAVYISHRLASTRFCDRIILISGNGIAEEGTHRELMDKRGRYYDMFITQGKYYQNEEEAV